MLRQFLNKQLDDQKESKVILIGEDHFRGSVAVALASEIDTLKKHKKIVFLSETLVRLTDAHDEDKPYTIADVKERLNNYDSDKQALMALIEAGIEVYGLESKITAPTSHFVSTDKPALYAEIQQKLPNLLLNEDTKSSLETYLWDSSIDFETFQERIESYYSKLDERIEVPNREFSQQLIDLIRAKENTVFILGVGATHIPEAIKTTSGTMLDKGIRGRLHDEFKEMEIATCFVCAAEGLKYGDTYTPRGDQDTQFGKIDIALQTPFDFSFKIPEKKKTVSVQNLDEVFIKKIGLRVTELKKSTSSMWDFLNKKKRDGQFELKFLTEILDAARSIPLQMAVANIVKKYEKEYKNKLSPQIITILNEINSQQQSSQKITKESGGGR